MSKSPARSKADGVAAGFDIVTARALDGVPHGFFGSSDGAHQFGYGGPGDEGDVRRARAGAAEAVCNSASLVATHQVHSPDVISVTEGWDDAAQGRPAGDALVTAKAGLVLGIVTADCAPVLFADTKAGVVGAAHAGWRGAHGGVLENTLAAMEHLGASREWIVAAIGPTIAQPSYGVDGGFRAQFADEDAAHFRPAPKREGIERWHFDLPGYILARLAKAGLTRIEDIGADTYTQPTRYYSYRRSTHLDEPNYGRQISMIALSD